jgi:hypothetical protein
MLRGTACVAALAAAGAASAAGESWTVRASATFQHLGAWEITRDATYADARAALGPADSCTVRPGDPRSATARWATGVRVALRTYSSLPPGKNGCTAPARIYVHTARVAGPRWHTSFGLRVGDAVARLRSLYPRASAHSGLEGWYGRGYWLVTRRSACVGDCARAFVTVPQLVAEVSGGRVSAFVFVVGAEGE